MKAHLIDSEDPLREGVTIKAICGTDVLNAAFAFQWNEEAGVGVNQFYDSISLSTCRNCLGFCLGKRYIYGIVSGQESKHPEAA